MADYTVTTEQLKDLLLNKGIKPSIQRLSVLRYIMEQMDHPSVEKIYQNLVNQIPTLSKTTVYNTLKQLTEKGIINALSIDEVQIKYDYPHAPHAHFLCTHCGIIYDIEMVTDLYGLQSIDGHQVMSAQINFKGICNNCKQ